MAELRDGPKSKPGSERYESLLPLGVPRYIRCYDDESTSFDRFTVVFSKVTGYPYLAMSNSPYHPQGFGQHGEGQRMAIDCPTYGHLGKKIQFGSLPLDCQHLTLADYAAYWHLDTSEHPLNRDTISGAFGRLWKPGVEHWQAPHKEKR